MPEPLNCDAQKLFLPGVTPLPFKNVEECDPFFSNFTGIPSNCKCKEGYVRDGTDVRDILLFDFNTGMCLKLEECHAGCIGPDGRKLAVSI